MVPETTVKQVIELLQVGMSQREISALVGVSRSTVQSIACGRHRHVQRPRATPTQALRCRDRPVGRCGNCGHMVRLPCLICHLRRLLKDDLRQKRQRLQSAATDPLQIELRGHDRERYERIHARKVHATMHRCHRRGGDE